MIVRMIMFFGAIIVFGLFALLMYGDLKANKRKIDRSVKAKKRKYNDEYLKIYK